MRRLTLSDFRCYRHQRIETDRRPVVLTGPNGAGKTNVLEALSFLVPGRGLRRARLSEVARYVPGDGEDQRPWAVAATVVTPKGAVDIGTGRDAPGGPAGRERRLVRIDGRPARGQAALAEVLNAVWLTPWMDRLFGDAPAARRRFIDRLVFGFDPAHAGRVGAFENAQRQRAHLLRRDRAQGSAADADWLAALEDTMAAQGVAVAAARRDLAARLGEIGCRPPGPFPGVAVEMTGPLEDWLAQGPALAAEDRMRDGLAAARRHDAERGGTAVGRTRATFGCATWTRDWRPSGARRASRRRCSSPSSWPTPGCRRATARRGPCCCSTRWRPTSTTAIAAPCSRRSWTWGRRPGSPGPTPGYSRRSARRPSSSASRDARVTPRDEDQR